MLFSHLTLFAQEKNTYIRFFVLKLFFPNFCFLHLRLIMHPKVVPTNNLPITCSRKLFFWRSSTRSRKRKTGVLCDERQRKDNVYISQLLRNSFYRYIYIANYWIEWRIWVRKIDMYYSTYVNMQSWLIWSSAGFSITLLVGLCTYLRISAHMHILTRIYTHADTYTHTDTHTRARINNRMCLFQSCFSSL